MKQTKGRFLNGTIAVLGAAVAVIPLAVYNLIEVTGMHGMHALSMACERVCTATVFIGAAISAVALASLFFKNTKLGVAGSAALLTGGVAAIVVPRTLGFCESADMACRYITAPTLSILGSAIIVLSLVRLITGVAVIRKASVAT